MLAVTDTGGGMSPEVMARAFEPFYSTKPEGKGTGLGLDISYRIVVKKHHGDLRVQSQPGDTRFVVTLPVAAEPPATPLIGSAPLIEAAAPIEAAQP